MAQRSHVEQLTFYDSSTHCFSLRRQRTWLKAQLSNYAINIFSDIGKRGKRRKCLLCLRISFPSSPSVTTVSNPLMDSLRKKKEIIILWSHWRLLTYRANICPPMYILLEYYNTPSSHFLVNPDRS